MSPVAGVKRPAPAPSLLPAFEASSSSPTLPRPAKRIALESPTHGTDIRKYPTPVPTSSTGVMTSSPPQLLFPRRSCLQRTVSTLSERVPLSTVPIIELDEGGEPTLMGRSSNSSHYQLSTHKMISRVHVRLVYVAGQPPSTGEVIIECTGWNGIKVHTQTKAFELAKGDIFTNDVAGTDIMIDVQDARVIVPWPKSGRKLSTPDTESSFDSENSPRQALAAARRQSPFSSPLKQHARLQSPVSPSPAIRNPFAASSSLLTPDHPSDGPVQIYEDILSDDDGQGKLTLAEEATQSTQYLSQPLSTLEASQLTGSSDANEFSDQDEENDPIIHSFGPSGSNLLPRMAQITAGDSPVRSRPLSTLRETTASPQRPAKPRSTEESEINPVVNHVVNQLAFSRLSSTPLSTLVGNLPTALKCDTLGLGETHQASMEALKLLLRETPCIGEVSREGKDAAGRRLESEYYYMAHLDSDEGRRDAVEDLKKPGLRACRKQHKVGIFLTKRLDISS